MDYDKNRPHYWRIPNPNDIMGVEKLHAIHGYSVQNDRIYTKCGLPFKSYMRMSVHSERITCDRCRVAMRDSD